MHGGICYFKVNSFYTMSVYAQDMYAVFRFYFQSIFKLSTCKSPQNLVQNFSSFKYNPG